MLMLALLLGGLLLFLHQELVHHHRSGYRQQTDQKRIGKELVLIDILPAAFRNAVVDQLIVSFGQGDDERIESEEDYRRGYEKITVLPPGMPDVRYPKVESETTAQPQQFQQNHT
jgi:hypothetical protein